MAARVDPLIALNDLHDLHARPATLRGQSAGLLVGAGELRAIAAKGACGHATVSTSHSRTETTRPIWQVLF